MVEPARPADLARERLAGELRAAMKARDAVMVRTVRSLLSALDNKSAVAMAPERRPRFERSAEAPRREATAEDIEAVFAGELAERSAAEADFERRGLTADAARLRDEMAVIRRLWSNRPPRPR